MGSDVERHAMGLGKFRAAGWWKVFSPCVLSPEDLETYFDAVDQVHVVEWKHAYPQYSEYKTISPFKLGEGLVLTSPLEGVASALEMACISGRNAALLVRQHLLQSGLVTEC